jgi:hypothetical protein
MSRQCSNYKEVGTLEGGWCGSLEEVGVYEDKLAGVGGGGGVKQGSRIYLYLHVYLGELGGLFVVVHVECGLCRGSVQRK